ncbi:MAG: hypothetical protein IJ833_07700 [Lachnospiraceae bacterium]|nr:hypothetical protein [Lachnospiraceae bacterium]
MKARGAHFKVQDVVYIGIVLLTGSLLSWYLYAIGAFPRNIDTDTFGHLFKTNYLYHSLKKGIWYPIYTEYWYNGMELFRYWPPLSYYIMTLFQFFTGGDVLNAFYIFVGFVYALNMLGWMLFGKREQRLGMAFLVGNLYFFCPDNLRVLFAEGNLPRILITSLVPFVFYFVWEVIHYERLVKLIPLGITVILITFSHYMIAAMLGISVFVFCMVYAIAHGTMKNGIFVILDLGLAYLASGICLLPGLTGGGLVSQSSEASVATINQWAQEALKSLNPFNRYEVMTQFYFGLVIFAVILMGMLAANRDTVSGFVTAFLIFVSTTTAASTVVRLLPMSQVFWMTRFVPMAMCTFFLSIFLWKRLKRKVIIIVTVAMIIDVLPTLQLITLQSGEPIAQYMQEDMEQYLMDDAVALTKNRLGVLDNSLWGAIPSYYLSRDMNSDSTLYSFGWAYQGAETMENIVSVNESAERGCYAYTFDRMLELGDDTILVYKRLIPAERTKDMLQAAKRVGYDLIQENDKVWVFHIDTGTSGSFGVKKEYKNLAIGKDARAICYIYPQFGYGNSVMLEDYSAEELCSYDKLYLSGFTYHDKEAAEALLKQTADSGTKIYIDMQHIPTNELTGKAEFMDVYAQYVAFTERFPIMETANGSQFKLNFSTAGYASWNTVYLSGMEETLKSSFYDEKTHLTYLGRNGNKNIYFMGFNTVYYYIESGGAQLLTYLNEVLDEEPDAVCESRLVPIEVKYAADRITVEAPEQGVITGVANLDCFEREDGAAKKVWDHMLLSDEGRSVYEVHYSDFKLGLGCSVAGVIGLIIFWMIMLRKLSQMNKLLQKEKEGEVHETYEFSQ